MQAFFTAFKQFFNMFTILFMAGEGAARMVGNVVKIGEGMSEAALLKHQLETNADMALLKRQLEAKAQAALPATTASTVV